ncbi:MAG: sigma-70 family RNA polymerase sigma factor [Clostridia bacterium]|nr:sigma-70 family RNA polymerase sigma factor [Clostridia bacterium]
MTAENEILLREYCSDRSDNLLRDRVYEAFLPLAGIIARKFSGRGVDYDDLFQVGGLALFKALERFDPDKGVKFVTFATPTIVGEIKNFFRDRSRLITLPRRSGMMLKKLNEAKDQLINELHRTPTAQELADAVGETIETVLEILEMQGALNPVSLDMSASSEDEDFNLYSVMGFEDKGYQSVEFKDMVQRALKQMTETERKIITERFFNNRSQREVADILGVSQMTVSRNEKKAVERFRALIEG